MHAVVISLPIISQISTSILTQYRAISISCYFQYVTAEIPEKIPKQRVIREIFNLRFNPLYYRECSHLELSSSLGIPYTDCRYLRKKEKENKKMLFRHRAYRGTYF